MLDDRFYESVIKNVLSKYKDDYNEVNKEDNDPIDFSIDMTKQELDFDKVVEDQKMSKEKEVLFRENTSKENYYLRLTKQYKNSKQIRVIFAAYRPCDLFKKANDAKKELLQECLSNLIIGGLEYSEAMYLMSEGRQKEVLD